MTALYISAAARFYVTYRAIDGTYDVRTWPSQNILANYDWFKDARIKADALDT